MFEYKNKLMLGIIGIIIFSLFVFTVLIIYEMEETKKDNMLLLGGYNQLLQQYNNTAVTQIEDYNELIDNYNKLVEKYNSLIETHNELNKNSVAPPYIRIFNRTIELGFYFENENTLNIWSWPIEEFEESYYRGKIMRENELSEIDQFIPGLSQRFDKTKYFLIDKELAINLKPYIESEHFNEISTSIYNKYKTDEERIRAVWYLTTNLNTYTDEIEQTPRLPLETLLGGGGDCKDSSVLVASMLKAMNSEWKVDLVYVDLNNIENPKNLNHVIVYVDTGEYSTYIETTTNIDVNIYENVKGYHFEII